MQQPGPPSASSGPASPVPIRPGPNSSILSPAPVVAGPHALHAQLRGGTNSLQTASSLSSSPASTSSASFAFLHHDLDHSESHHQHTDRRQSESKGPVIFPNPSLILFNNSDIIPRRNTPDSTPNGVVSPASPGLGRSRSGSKSRVSVEPGRNVTTPSPPIPAVPPPVFAQQNLVPPPRTLSLESQPVELSETDGMQEPHWSERPWGRRSMHEGRKGSLTESDLRGDTVVSKPGTKSPKGSASSSLKGSNGEKTSDEALERLQSKLSPVSDLRNSILRDINKSLAPTPYTPITPGSPSHGNESPHGSSNNLNLQNGVQTPPRSPLLGRMPTVGDGGLDRAERIAQLVRQHKDNHTDPVTGASVIPKRTSSFLDAEERDHLRAALNLSGSKSDGRRSAGSRSELSSPTSPASSTFDNMMAHNGAVGRVGGLPPSGFGYKPTASPALVETPAQSYVFSPLGAGACAEAGAGHASHAVNHRGTIPPPLSIGMKGGEEVSSPAEASAEASIKDYKRLEPADVATRLYNLTLGGITKEGVCTIIGKQDEYHSAMLVHYMDLYEFYGMTLDDAFRHLCTHLQLAGETQMVDRILYQFSRRFWECNIDAQQTFRSIDIVYGILFSLVLLNTDLHIANVGSSNKKMPRKTFVKNTTELIDKMIVDDETVRDVVNSMGPEGVKRWRKDIDGMLKLREMQDLYTSVKDNRIRLQRADPELRQASSDAQTPTSVATPVSASVRRSNSVGKRASAFSKPYRGMQATTTSLSNPSSATSSSPATGFFRSSPQLNPLERKGTPLLEQSIASSADSVRVPAGRGSMGSMGSLGSGGILSSNDASASSLQQSSVPPLPIASSLSNSPAGIPASESPNKSTPTSASGTFASMRRSSISSDRSAQNQGAAGGFNGREGVTLEGLLIRKHLTDHNETRARNRRWVKVWCVMAIDDERGAELTMFKVEPGLGDGEVNFDVREVADYGRALGGGTMVEERRGSSDSIPKKVLRISNQPPLVFNLLHSLANTLKAPGYNPSRPFVFSLLLINGSSHLFQAPTPEATIEWTRTLNYWAARRSKEPLRGAVSSTEYGWNFAAIERRSREREDLEREKRGEVLVNAAEEYSSSSGDLYGSSSSLEGKVNGGSGSGSASDFSSGGGG
ncbi:hypothetical protein HK101_002680, partial [Irineochytrium annulatum]